MYKFNSAYRRKTFTILNIQCTETETGYVLQNCKNTISVVHIDKYYISEEDIIYYVKRDGSTLCAPNFREQLRFDFMHRLKPKDIHLKENDHHSVMY